MSPRSGSVPFVLLALGSIGVLGLPGSSPAYLGGVSSEVWGLSDCASCHGSTNAPTVSIEYDNDLNPQRVFRASRSYDGFSTLLVNNDPTKYKVAGHRTMVKDGALRPGTRSKVNPADARQIAHANAAFPFDASGNVSFPFSLSTPASSGTLPMEALGNAGDGDNSSAGDAGSATAASFQVQIVDRIVELDVYGQDGAAAGSSGMVPSLGGQWGDASGGASVEITNAVPDQTGFVLISTSRTNGDAFGPGKLYVDVAVPFGRRNFKTDASGATKLDVGDLTFIPSGTSIYIQAVIRDTPLGSGSGNTDFSLSNALELFID